MTRSDRYHGVVGATVGVLSAFVVLCALATPLRGAAMVFWKGVTWPVTRVWMLYLVTLDVDHSMLFILPVLVSQVAFVALLGFGGGVMIGRLRSK